MKRMGIRARWSGPSVAAALALCLAPEVGAGSVALDVRMSKPAVLARGPQTAHLYVGLTGAPAGPRGRAPVNVAIVLDQSGSMSGRKIEEAKRAAVMAIGRLGRDDTVSLIAYQSTVDVLVPATKLRDPGPVRRAIGSLQAGGSTALFGGVSKGAQELRKFPSENRVNTLLLLSDGIANVGPSSPGELAQLGASLAREGIAVTTIGLGLDYNEDLMTRLALASDGNHFFVEEAADLERAFAAELGEALSAVAQGVEVHIRCPRGVRPIRVLGRDAQVSGQDVWASFGQVYRDQTRYLVLEVELPAGRPGSHHEVAQVELGYRDLLAGSQATATGRTRVAYTDSPSVVEAQQQRDVSVAVVSQIGVEKNALAVALRDEGKLEAARAAFAANASFLKEKAVELDNEKLERDATTNFGAAENLEGEKWRRQRKLQQEMQVQTIQQRVALPEAGQVEDDSQQAEEEDP
jgi:Ca-activated chloride channel homolog